MSRERTFVIPAPAPKPGWPCPRCHGIGNMQDGSTGYSHRADGSTEVTIRESTKCYLCKGSGRVECTAITETGGEKR